MVFKKQFKNKNKPNKGYPTNPETGPIRARTPRENQIIGVIEQRLGANRLLVKCFDGKERNCRIPGGLRRKLWIRPGDTVIVQPWEFEKDKKGDVLYKYRPAEIEWLKRKGIIKEVVGEF